MADIRVCVGNFVWGAGLGTVTQAYSDAQGTFLAKIILFQGGYCFLNALGDDAGGGGAYLHDEGIAIQGFGGAGGSGDAEQASLKITCGAGANGYSIMNMRPQLGFGGSIDGLAIVTDIRVGEFDYDTVLRDIRSGDSRIFVAIGGDDVTITLTNTLSNGTVTTGAPVKGLLNSFADAIGPIGSPVASVGAGGGISKWGWAAKDSGIATIFTQASNQGSNTQALYDDRCGISGTPIVSDWGATSYTISGSTSESFVQIAFSGESVACGAGFATQEAGATQVIETGVSNPKLLLIGGTGQTTPGSSTPTCQMVLGYVDSQLNHGGWWTGETTVGNNPPLQGARYLSDETALRFGTPAAASTTFTTLASVTAMAANGDITLAVPTNDAVPRLWAWFVLGDTTAPTPPPTPVYRTREVVRRRLRRAPIVWSEKGGLQTRVRINLFAVDMQPGVGTSDTPDPLVMIRCSKDGGFTWGNERRLTAGRVGEYFERINAWQWGQGRDWVFEVACTDPVTWNLLGAYLDVEGGEN